MSGKKYVPEGVFLVCDKGAKPSQLRSLTHMQSDLYGQNMCTELDMIPFVNFDPFGACACTGGMPCVPAPLLWTNSTTTITVGPSGLLLEHSELICALGGKIKIFYTMRAAMAVIPKPKEEERGFWSKAWGFTKGFGKGLWKGAKGTVMGVVDLTVWASKHTLAYQLLNPQGYAEQLQKDKETFTAIGNAAKKVGTWAYRNSAVNMLTDPQDYMKAQQENKEAFDALMDKAGDMSAEEWGDFAGQVVFEVALEVGTAGGAAALTAVKAADKTLDVVKAVDKIDDGLDALKAAENAADAAKIAENAPSKPVDIGDVVHKTGMPDYKDLGKNPPCFLEGTLVKTPTGYTAIEILNVGDEVLSYDFNENCIKEKRIVKLYNNFTYRYYEVKTDGGNSIFATSRHLFWIENEQKWIPTRDLHVGTQLKGINDELDTVLSIKETRNINLPTFNLEIEDIHNYFVGEFGILVHNQNGSSKFTSTKKTQIQFYVIKDTKGKVVYVGQTDKLDVNDRFEQHKKAKPTKKITAAERKKWQNYKIKEIDSRYLTPYEAAAWEQHYIEKHGGKANLQNGRNEITEKKYNEYGKDKYGHNPCP